MCIIFNIFNYILENKIKKKTYNEYASSNVKFEIYIINSF